MVVKECQTVQLECCMPVPGKKDILNVFVPLLESYTSRSHELNGLYGELC